MSSTLGAGAQVLEPDCQSRQGQSHSIPSPRNPATVDHAALQRLGLQGLTILQAKFLRILPLWRRRIHQALEQSRDTLAVLCESQRKEAEKSLRRRFYWLFENGSKGIQRILGKRKPQKVMDYVTQPCPCGLQWRREDSIVSRTKLTLQYPRGT
jgi:hypothetical protein